jgi:uncharacterized protein (TIGR03067 family)
VPEATVLATLRVEEEPPPSPATWCPECEATLAAGAVLCVSCGLDLRTGGKLRTPTPRKRQDRSGDTALVWGGIGAAAGLAVVGIPIVLFYALSGPARTGTPKDAGAQARADRPQALEAAKQKQRDEEQARKDLAAQQEKERARRKEQQEKDDLLKKELAKKKQEEEKELTKKKQQEEEEALIKKYVTPREIELLKNPPPPRPGDFGGSLNMTPLRLAQARASGVQITIRDPAKEVLDDLFNAMGSGAAANSPAAKKDFALLQNPLPPKRDHFAEWACVEVHPPEDPPEGPGGRLGPGLTWAGSKLQFTDHEFSLVMGTRASLIMGRANEKRGYVKLDPAAKPKTIDLLYDSGSGGDKLYGIYELKPGLLRMRLGAAGAARPKEFTDEGGGRLVTFQAVYRKNALAMPFP